MDAEYNVGDVVRISGSLKTGEYAPEGCYCVSYMLMYRGRVAQIREVTIGDGHHYYRLDVDDGAWSWVKGMFDPKFGCIRQTYKDVEESDLLNILSV